MRHCEQVQNELSGSFHCTVFPVKLWTPISKINFWTVYVSSIKCKMKLQIKINMPDHSMVSHNLTQNNELASEYGHTATILQDG